jgi:hypothetical protein
MRGNLKSYESRISNPRSEICNLDDRPSNPKFRISDLRWAFVRFHNFPPRQVTQYVDALAEDGRELGKGALTPHPP